MASEQTKVRKKKSRNLNQEQPCAQVLYRHQDCIPSPKLHHNCEQHRLFGCNHNQEGDTLNKLAGTEEINNLKTKKVNINPKHARKLEKRNEETDLSLQPNDKTEKSNEEFSKSRKRRIRKQRLLTSLAPSLKPSNNSSLPVENATQTKPSSNALPVNNVLPVPIISNNESDLSKTSPKNSRKRFEKSIGFRNKSVKNKTLVDCTNQHKSDIIKSIEEKTLNSLLQTLAPLTNSSPKKEKIPTTPLFTFPEKRLSGGSTKVDKDGVFYFGETKHQLEKLTSQLNKNSVVAQSNHLNENVSFVNKFIDTNNCILPCTDSINNLTTTETINNSNLLSLTNKENKGLFSFGSTELKSKELVLKTPTQENLSHLPKDLPELNQPFVHAPATSVIEGKVSSGTEVIENKKVAVEQLHHLPNNVPVPLSDNTIEQKGTLKNLNIMKSTDEIAKPNKSREEILLEREAKKAAKLAAKAKNKINSSKKEVADDSKKPESSKPSKSNNKESNIENTNVIPQKVPASVVEDRHKKVSSDYKQATSQPSQPQHKVDSSQELVKDESTKSKAELKAERRAKQEAQRAAKATAKTVQPVKEQQEKAATKIKKEPPKTDSKSGQTEKKQEVTKTIAQPKPKLFSHLYLEKPSSQITKLGGLHPAIVRLGVQYATRVVVGSNARCVALLHALKQMIKAYSTPSEKEFARGLEEELGPVTIYLNQCRPLAVSMTNALKHIKRSLVQLPNIISDVEARRKMCDLVDTYIHEQIDMAGKAICQTVELKISNGDVILTYGCSSLVYRILVESHQNGKKFRVVVVDGLPWQEGREMLRRLVDKGLSCTYVLISAASFIMREASKVLLGAHALLANGCVMSRAGSSQVALLAHCYNVPVLVCCETHKFSERVQTDAFVYNELGELCCEKIKDKNRVAANLTPLSLAYDITPPDLVSAVVTERAILPCTSVPVILRIKPSESVL